MTTATTRYLSAAETAKLVRQALKREFPGVKFSVRSDTYSGGASIDVRWTDGPRTKRVEAVAKQYSGANFDGMIDMKNYKSHWLRADGSVFLRYDCGTTGSAGSIPATDNRDLEPVMPADAEAVHFGADYIFCTRTLSNEDAVVAEADAWIRENCHIDADPMGPRYDRFGNFWVTELARSIAYLREDGDTWQAAFDRKWSPES